VRQLRRSSAGDGKRGGIERDALDRGLGAAPAEQLEEMVDDVVVLDRPQVVHRPRGQPERVRGDAYLAVTGTVVEDVLLTADELVYALGVPAQDDAPV
jgi:hypothetical protein